MQPNVEAQANQAAAQGQQLIANDKTNVASSQNDYGNYQGQADAANKQVGDYTNYMAGAGSAGNQYDTNLATQSKALGYDPAQMTAARTNLNQATGALSAYSDFANQGASKFGMNAGGFAAANSGALSGLNNNVASNQNVANGLQSLYTTAQTGANQRTGQVVQGEQNTLAGYQQQFSNAASQRDAAASQLQFWQSQLANQGTLNSQQAGAYAAARAAYSASTASLASAQQSIAAANLDKQKYDQLNATWAKDPNNPSYVPPAPMTKDTSSKQGTKVTSPHNQYFNVNNTNGSTLLGSLAADGINGLSGGANYLFGGLGAHSDMINNG